MKSSKTTCPANRVAELELQLKQAYSRIHFLQQANIELQQRVCQYESKCEDMRAVEEELCFRKDQERTMQLHLDNYQSMNARMRERIRHLEGAAQSSPLTINKVESRSTSLQLSGYQDPCCQLSTHVNPKCQLAESQRVPSNKGEKGKENHPLTPKSRVAINLSGKVRQELESLNTIKERRRVFM